MNVKNNKKYQNTEQHICEIFLQLLDENDCGSVSISKICQVSGITRATFYAHFQDMDGFFDAVAKQLFLGILDPEHGDPNWDADEESFYHYAFRRLFEHILDYRSFYQIYITKISQLPFLTVVSSFGDDKYLRRFASSQGITSHRQADYFSALFYTGLTAIIRLWLETDCQETPEEMCELISQQYHPAYARNE